MSGPMIKALNLSELCEALAAQLSEWPALQASRARVERAEPINEDPNRTPWIGIYRQSQSFTPRTLGLGSGYRRHSVTLAVVMQESSLQSGKECEQRMETMISEVVSAICSDETVRGKVLNLAEDPMAVSYSNYRVKEQSFYQEAVLFVTFQTNVNVISA